MTKQENHLFCRIAVHNQLISLEEANASLREALAAGKDAGEVLVASGSLTREQAAKIQKAVMRKKTAAQAGVPQAPSGGRTRPRGGRPRRREGAPRPAQNTSQLVLTISSLVVLVIVAVVFVIFWRQPPKEGNGTGGGEVSSASPSPKGSGNKGGGSSLSPGGSDSPEGAGTAPEATTPPTLSTEEREEIEKALGDALSDAMQCIGDATYRNGINSLEGFKKRFWAVADDNQKERFTTQYDRLKELIKKKYAADRERLVKAKEEGRLSDLSEISREIGRYADDETMKDVNELVRGGGSGTE